MPKSSLNVIHSWVLGLRPDFFSTGFIKVDLHKSKYILLDIETCRYDDTLNINVLYLFFSFP